MSEPALNIASGITYWVIVEKKEDQNLLCFQDSDTGASHAFRSTKPNTSYIFSLSLEHAFTRQAVLWREGLMHAVMLRLFSNGVGETEISITESVQTPHESKRDRKEERKEENSFSQCCLYFDSYGCGPVFPAFPKQLFLIYKTQ